MPKEQSMEIGPVVPAGGTWLAGGAAGVPALAVFASIVELVPEPDPS